jgi:hypothetical protein
MIPERPWLGQYQWINGRGRSGRDFASLTSRRASSAKLPCLLSTAGSNERAGVLSGRRILIVEDEMMVVWATSPTFTRWHFAEEHLHS